MAVKVFDPCVYHQPDPDEELLQNAGRLIHDVNELLDEDEDDDYEEYEEGEQLEFDFGDED